MRHQCNNIYESVNWSVEDKHKIKILVDIVVLDFILGLDHYWLQKSPISWALVTTTASLSFSPASAWTAVHLMASRQQTASVVISAPKRSLPPLMSALKNWWCPRWRLFTSPSVKVANLSCGASYPISPCRVWVMALMLFSSPLLPHCLLLCLSSRRGITLN